MEIRRTRPLPASRGAGAPSLEPEALARRIEELQVALEEIARLIPADAVADQTLRKEKVYRTGKAKTGEIQLWVRELYFKGGLLISSSPEIPAGIIEVGSGGGASTTTEIESITEYDFVSQAGWLGDIV